MTRSGRTPGPADVPREREPWPAGDVPPADGPARGVDRPVTPGFPAYRPEPYGTDPYATDPYGIEPHGIDPYGIEPHGIGPYGIEPHGIDPYGIDPQRIDAPPRPNGHPVEPWPGGPADPRPLNGSRGVNGHHPINRRAPAGGRDPVGRYGRPDGWEPVGRPDVGARREAEDGHDLFHGHYPVNRFPVDGIAPVRRPGVRRFDDEPATELLRRYVPVDEVLGREARDGPRRATAPRAAHPPRAIVRRRRARRRMLEWPFLIVFALLAAFVIRTFAVQTFYIPSASMHETLVEGDRVLVNKVGYRLHDVHRGDVVVFRRPANFPVDEEDLIKRVVGLPGETVEARDRRIYVDGRALTEPYVEPLCRGTEAFAPVRVPAEHLWVMGDNRCDSSDSRVFGPVGTDLVVGRAFVLAWPPDRLAWL